VSHECDSNTGLRTHSFNFCALMVSRFAWRRISRTLQLVGSHPVAHFFGRYCCGIMLPERSASQNTVTIHHRSPSFSS
jgi:hypothetical protein